MVVLVGGAPFAQAVSLNVCTDGPPEGFDVAQHVANYTLEAVGHTIFDQLMRFKPGTTELEPSLAEGVDISADRLRYTVRLRRGVQFQTTPWFTPTRTMNADDVVFSLHRQMDKKSPWNAVASHGFAAWTSFGPAESVRAIEKIDDYTVRIDLKAPNAPFLELLAHEAIGSVHSAEYASQLLRNGRQARINREPVGTGAWKLRSYQKDAVLRLQAHEGHWRGKPAIDELVFAITQEPIIRIQRMKAGECLVGSSLRNDTLHLLRDGPIEVRREMLLGTYYLPLNTARKDLSDPRLRRAMRLSLDQKVQIDAVFAGLGEPAGSILPPPVWSHDKTLVVTKDVQAARDLVKESSYAGRELVILAPSGGSADNKRSAELLQRDWAAAGIKTRVQMMEFGELLKRLGRGQYDVALVAYVGSSDPDSFFSPLLTCAAKRAGQNDSQWCDPALDKILDAARASHDRKERVELYRQAQRIVHEQVPLIPISYNEYFTGVHQRVKGFIPSPMGLMDFYGVSVADR